MNDTKQPSNVVKLVQPKEEGKFTQPFIDKFKPTKNGRFYATNHPNLCIRTQGTSSVYYTRKVNKKLSSGAIEVAIGNIKEIKLSEAVKIHQQNIALIASNVNPNKVDLGIQKEKEPTIYEYVEARLNRLEKSNNMADTALKLNKGLLNNHLIWLPKGATFSNLTDNQLQEFYLSRTPSVARQCISLLGATFNKLSPKQKRDSENPREVINRLEIVHKTKERKDVYLNFGGKRGDIGRFFEALTLAEHGYAPEEEYIIPSLTTSRTSIDIFMMYLLTSVRKENIANLKWSEVDFDNEEITLLEPKGRKGQNEPQLLPMSPYLKALLEFRHKSKTSSYVFPSVTNDKKGFDHKLIDHLGTKLALVMCIYGSWNKKENNPLQKKGEDKNLLSKSVWDKYSKIVRQGTDIELRTSLNKMGTKPHGLRRTLTNVAETIGIGSRNLEAILARKPTDVTGRHYLTIQSDSLREALHNTHKTIDNRIAEYFGLSYLDEEEGKEMFLSPILGFYGIKSLIETDKAYMDCGHSFEDLSRIRQYQYGDKDL